MVTETKLTPEEEKSYIKWMQSIGQTKQNGQNVDSNFTGIDYDYRGYYQKNGPVNIALGGHFTDEFKKPNHPTFSNESKYTSPDNPGGSWNGDTFIPSEQQLKSKIAKLVINSQNLGVGSNLPTI